MSMYIENVPNRGSRPAYLLRETRREGTKTVKRTLANLLKLSDETLRQSLRGVKLCEATKTFSVRATVPCGHVEAIRRAMERLGMAELVSSKPCRKREGRPISVQVYPGNTGDPKTVPDQAAKLRDDLGLERLVACFNPFLRDDRTRTRSELLAATEARLVRLQASAARRKKKPMTDEELGEKIGRRIARHDLPHHDRGRRHPSHHGHRADIAPGEDIHAARRRVIRLEPALCPVSGTAFWAEKSRKSS